MQGHHFFASLSVLPATTRNVQITNWLSSNGDAANTIYYKNIAVFTQNCYIFTPVGHHQAGMSKRSAVNT